MISNSSQRMPQWPLCTLELRDISLPKSVLEQLSTSSANLADLHIEDLLEMVSLGDQRWQKANDNNPLRVLDALRFYLDRKLPENLRVFSREHRIDAQQLFEFLEYCWRDGSRISLTYRYPPVTSIVYRAVRDFHRKAGRPVNVRLYMPMPVEWVQGRYSLREFFPGDPVDYNIGLGEEWDDDLNQDAAWCLRAFQQARIL